jgi:hypothetical protein
MQQVAESDEETCAYNDLALIRLDPADVPNVNPSVPAFGGPIGVGSWGGTGSTVYTYGNSSLRGGVRALSPKQGIVVQTSSGVWSHDVYTLTPGIPGDSGSGFLDSSGGAIGVLSTVQLAPLALNGVGDLPNEIGYMKTHGFSGTNLVPGTEPFNPNVAGAVLKCLAPSRSALRRPMRLGRPGSEGPPFLLFRPRRTRAQRPPSPRAEVRPRRGSPPDAPRMRYPGSAR